MARGMGFLPQLAAPGVRGARRVAGRRRFTNERKAWMQPDTQAAPISKTMLWAGRIASALPVVMLLFGGVMTLVKPPFVVEEITRLGHSESLVLGIGILELACTIVYAVPRTSVLGAILLTGYLGGATATHVRIGDPFYFPVVFGVLLWLGLFLRDERVRALIPLRTSERSRA